MSDHRSPYVMSEYRDPEPDPDCLHDETFRSGRQGYWVAIVCARCRGVLREEQELPSAD